MAFEFGQINGSAIKNTKKYLKFNDGETMFRMVGGVLPIYSYWEVLNGKNTQIECLAFNRDTERFDNSQEDPFSEAFPGVSPKWAYVCYGFDKDKPTELKIVALKKKLFQQIKDAAETLGSPTDPNTGWTIVVKRSGAGLTTEYSLQTLKCKTAPLTLEQMEALEKAPSIDEVFPRPTVAEVRAMVNRILESRKPSTEGEDAALEDVQY